MTRRLVTARIWFWQVRAARAAGWHVRLKPSLRLTAAVVVEIGDVAQGERNRLDRRLPPLRVDFEGNILGDAKAVYSGSRALRYLFQSLHPVRQISDLTQRLVRDGMKPIHDRSRKLSINEMLHLHGHPPIVLHPTASVVSERIQARATAGGESGSAA